MRINISRRVKQFAIAAAFGFMAVQPAMAVLEGTMRNQMEYLDYSESLIHAGLYAVSGHDVFDKDKRAYVHGITRHNAPRIYEPDVYTWELAMAEHRKKLAVKQPEISPAAPSMSPVPMAPPPILPTSPTPTYLQPAGPQSTVEVPGPLPANANEKMNAMIYRARARGLNPNAPLRASQLKQRLIAHMNSLGQNKQVPALMPALPTGHKGDSYDAGY